MKHLSFFLLTLFFVMGHAQNHFYSDGFEVTRYDVEQNVFSQDSTANALVIYEVGDSYVDEGTFKLNTKIKRKLKILNGEGFDRGTLEIYLYKGDNGKRQKIDNIRGTVYNIENNEVTKTQLEKGSIFKESYNDHYDVVKVVFPNIKEGSVINYSYTLETPFMFKYKSWNFQDDIPKLYSEYNASIPGNWEYNIKLVGGKQLFTNYANLKQNCLAINSKVYANCGIYKYVMKDIPAFIEEEYMTTRDNYLARIEYELKTFRSFRGEVDNFTKSWKHTDREIEKDTDLGRQLKKINTVDDLLGDGITSESDPLKKAEHIFKFVQDNYAWNKEYHVFEDISIKNLLKNKSGNVGEINALLHNLLKAHGIEAQPILLSTRNNGLVTKIFPVMSDFNYLIVKADINGKPYLLDATEDDLSFGQIPFRCLNQYGRLLDFEQGSRWYDINVDDFSVVEYRYDLQLDKNQILEGSVDYNSTGYHALSDYKRFGQNLDNYIDSYANSYDNIEFSNFEIAATESTVRTFNSKFHVEVTPESSSQMVYLNPYLFKFFTENPFKLQQRSYPIDFGYKNAFTYRIKLTVEDAFEIKELPEAINMALPNNAGSFVSAVQQDGNVITIYFKLSLKKPIYEPAYYDSLKTLLGKVVDVQKQSLIVLERKQ